VTNKYSANRQTDPIKIYVLCARPELVEGHLRALFFEFLVVLNMPNFSRCARRYPSTSSGRAQGVLNAVFTPEPSRRARASAGSAERSVYS